MRWKWRAITLPKGADGRDPRKDDQAMVLYIGAKSFLKNKSISYRWETETPVGITGKASYGGGLVCQNLCRFEGAGGTVRHYAARYGTGRTQRTDRTGHGGGKAGHCCPLS